MNGLTTLPILQAENDYRRKRISHEWAAANATTRSVRRRLRLLARLVTGGTPGHNRTRRLSHRAV